jgi:hypothetical protein
MMKTFSYVAIATLALTTAAAAQDMTPPPELAAAAKASAGTWKCKGQGMDHTMKMIDTTGTLKIKLDLDNWWLHASYDSMMGKEGFHFESFSTFDAQAKKWKRVLIETGGGWSSGESDGMKDNKLDWTLSMHSPRGDIAFRDHQDMTDPKAGMKLSGEFTADGKTWTTVYTLACKK